MLVLLLLLLWATSGYAANETATDPVQLLRQRLGTIMPGSYMVSGCLPAVPASSTTLAAFACEGVVYANAASVPVVQTAAAVGALTGGDGTYWLVLHPDRTSTVSGWTRQSGTHYLWQKAATQPALTDLALLAKVTVAGGVISAIDDWRVPASYVRSGTYDVTDPLYGGVADDSTDIGPALRVAIAAVRAQRASTVTLPEGVYTLSSAVPILSLGASGDGGLTLKGAGWNPPVPALLAQTDLPRRGTWIHLTSPSFNPFTFEASNITVEDMAFDQDHPASAPGWAATDYPYVFTIQNPVGWLVSDITFKNVFFWKINKGVHQASVASQSSARMNFYDVYGQFFREGIFLAFNSDVSRFHNVHLWPFWSADADVMKFSEEHLVGFRFWRVDNPNMTNIFVFGAKDSLLLESNAIGPTSLLLATNVGSDRSVRGLTVTQDNATIRLTNFYHASGGVGAIDLPGSAGIFLNGTNNNLFATNVDILGVGSFCLGASHSFFNVTNFRCAGYNLANVGQPAVVISGSGAGNVTGYSHIAGGVGGMPEYFGTFLASDNPGGAYFNATRSFYAAMNVNDPTLNFAASSFLQWLSGSNLFKIGGAGGNYSTGGVKQYLCIQDGVLTVGATCP